MRHNMHDFIAALNKLGYPDNFLAMACNSQWHEINNTLLTGLNVTGRPNLAASVFQIMLHALMTFMVNTKYLAT